MRIIGLDIHRAFAEAVAWDDGKLKRLGRVDMRRPLLEAFAKKLSKDEGVVVEATGNAASVAAVIAPHVKKVVIANPKQVRIIAHAKIKTDTIDASVLGGFRREVQPRRQHWFLNEKSGFPFRTPAFCSVSRGRRRLGEKEYRAPSVTPGVALRPRTQGP